MTTTTECTKAQLATVLSALDDQPRNPANRAAALTAIARSAERLGLTADEVLAAAPGLLDGRCSPETWRAELRDQVDPTRTLARAHRAAVVPETDEDGAEADDAEAEAAEAPEPATAPAAAADAEALTAPESAAKPTPRTGTKQALLIDLLRRPEGATVAQIAQITGWQRHTIRGAISGALKKKLGLTVTAERVRHTGPNAKGGTTVYRIVEPA